MAADEPEQTLGRIMSERREKARRLGQGGRNPYRNDVRPTHDLAAIRRRYEPTRPPPPAEAAPPAPSPLAGAAWTAMTRTR